MLITNIENLLYFVYVIHYNAFIVLYHFVLTNIMILIMGFCMFYVFGKKNTLLEQSAIRPYRKSMGTDYYGNNILDDVVMATLSQERLKIIGVYVAILASTLVCFLFATRVVLYMMTLMWIVGALSVRLMKGDREEMANKIQNYSLGYCLILIMIKIMISLAIGTSMSDWSRSLGVALPASAAGTIQGYLPMMFLIMTFGFPLAYFRVVAQRYSIAHDNEDVVKRREEIMRTGNQNKLVNQYPQEHDRLGW